MKDLTTYFELIPLTATYSSMVSQYQLSSIVHQHNYTPRTTKWWWHKWSLACECVVHNDLRPRPISSMSSSLDFTINLLKYVISCRVRCTAQAVLNGFFPYLAQMGTSIRGGVVCYVLWSWLISSMIFSHEFAIKLLKYGTTCRFCSTTHTVLDGFFMFWHTWSLA